MKKEIIIIGGGIAGLSAAVHAIRHDFRPIILEKNKHLGGRVRSFFSPDIETTIDNGQHVLSAAYEETLRLLRTIQSVNKISFQKRFQTFFVRDKAENFIFKTGSLPPPLHFFIPLMKIKNLTNSRLRDYMRLLWLDARIQESKLHDMTIIQWLEHCAQPGEMWEFLWKPLTHSILNTSIHEGSAYLLKRAISKSFFHSSKKARLILPHAWLNKIFNEPAQKYIEIKGGEFHFLTAVEKLIIEKNKIQQLETKRLKFNAPWVISTIPPFALESVLESSKIETLENLRANLSKFDYNPIITINIFLHKPIEASFPIAFISSPLHWLFRHPSPTKHNTIFGYAVVMSAANDWALESRENIIKMVSSELHRLLGINLETSHKLIKYKIVKEKRATISQTPAAQRIRPDTKTSLQNFFLAGDWTNTDLPATIEGAIVSGRLAIEKILKSIKTDAI